MTRSSISVKLLREIKLAEDEVNLLTEIKEVVESIYDSVIHYVKNTTYTSYRYRTNQRSDNVTGGIYYHLSSCMVNEKTVLKIVDILSGLLIDTTVEHKIVMNGRQVDTYILVDWSDIQ